jgi:hypothetical protein
MKCYRRGSKERTGDSGKRFAKAGKETSYSSRKT